MPAPMTTTLALAGRSLTLFTPLTESDGPQCTAPATWLGWPKGPIPESQRPRHSKLSQDSA